MREICSCKETKILHVSYPGDQLLRNKTYERTSSMSVLVSLFTEKGNVEKYFYLFNDRHNYYRIYVQCQDSVNSKMT